MPPKLKPDDFVDALLESRVVEALAKALAPFITLSIDEALNNKLAGLISTIGEVKKETASLVEKNRLLTLENKSLNERLTTLEEYSRCDNLIIRGIPELSAAERASSAPLSSDSSLLRESHQQVENSVLSLCRDTLGVKIQPGDISIAHRLKAGPKDRVRPIIVRFNSRRVRNDVYAAKKELRQSNTSTAERIFISEHLTKDASDLFYEARKLLKEKKIFAAWTQSGQVFVRFTSDPSNRPAAIKCKADLNPRS
jgi:hypothetical protein